jgi:hypothetical protein
MCAPMAPAVAAAWIMAGTTAAATTATLVAQNQATQHAKGAAEAQAAALKANPYGPSGPPQQATAVQTNPIISQANKLSSLRRGVLSTVGTNPWGIKGSDLATLGQPAAYAAGQKVALGQ